jgi:hypothetical protein
MAEPVIDEACARHGITFSRHSSCTAEPRRRYSPG